MAGYNYKLGTYDLGEPPKAATLYADPFDQGPDYSAMSYEDMKRLEAGGNKRATIAAGIGGLGSAAQIAAAALPTATDIENDRRLAELKKHKGLTEGQRADIDEQAMRKVNAFAGESQARTDNALAASGQTSAAALNRARIAEKTALNNAAIDAADIGIRENRAQVQRDTIEEQERIGEKGKREAEIKGLVARTISEAVLSVAKPMAAGIVADEPTDAQLLWMQSAKDANGNPLYPGLQGASGADSIRRMYRAMGKQQNRPDGAVQMA